MTFCPICGPDDVPPCHRGRWRPSQRDNVMAHTTFDIFISCQYQSDACILPAALRCRIHSFGGMLLHFLYFPSFDKGADIRSGVVRNEDQADLLSCTTLDMSSLLL